MHRAKPHRPLSDAEIDELDQFLLYADVEDSMTLDMLDGYLHALAVGPARPTPQQWMPRIWGENHKDTMPPTRDAGQARRMVDLVQRLFLSIVQRLDDARGATMAPLWSSFEESGVEYDDAQIWACGFLDGLELCRDAWQPLLDTQQGQAWLRPLRELGEDAPDAEAQARSATAMARQKLSHEIPDAVLSMHAYWRASRRAEAQGDDT